MHTLVFTKRSEIFRAIAQKFDLVPKESEVSGILQVAENASLGVVLCKQCSHTLVTAWKAYQAERVYFVDFSLSTLEERHIGDIVLPNVFFTLDSSLRDTEITKDTIDTFAKDALFLETYEKQGDFDFSDFGLSVGGTCVSEIRVSEWVEDLDFLEKIGNAYAADVLDSEAYSFVQEAVNASWKNPCIVLGISGGYAENTAESSIEETILAERISSIVAFLEDTLHSGENMDLLEVV